MTDANPFWDYSLRLYPHIEQLCLELQDQRGININLLLFNCFAGSCGVRFTTAIQAELAALVNPWDETAVQPLRKLRRTLKKARLPGASEVQHLIKTAELAAEQQLQRQLFNWWQSHTKAMPIDPHRALGHNLSDYLGDCPIPGNLVELALLAGK